MKVVAYSDGSRRKKKIASCSILYTRSGIFVGSILSVSDGNDSYMAELTAVYNIIKFLETSPHVITKVSILSDLMTLSEQFKKYKQEGKVKHSSSKAREMWNRIIEYSERVPLKIKYHEAHVGKEHNPNKACDIVARTRLCSTDL